jgi:hypothetical protein
MPAATGREVVTALEAQCRALYHNLQEYRVKRDREPYQAMKVVYGDMAREFRDSLRELLALRRGK